MEVLEGLDGVVRMVQDPETDRVLSAIVGAAGLEGTWAALEAGKIVALANKETLVVAGSLVMELARSRGASLLPVDSEHSAIFQALQAGAHKEVRRVILTSSGGPFRGKTRARAHRRDPGRGAQAPDLADGPEDHDRLGHADEQGTGGHRGAVAVRARARPDRGGDPSRERGPFDGRVRRRQRDRSALAAGHAAADPVCSDLSGPLPGTWPSARLSRPFALHFEPPDRETFPCLDLGFEVMRRGGTAGAALNAANEAAVARFLGSEIGFLDIPRACRAALDSHTFDSRPTLEQLWKVDARARREVECWKP